MRRSRFATSDNPQLSSGARWLEALSFDVRNHAGEDQPIAEQRLAHLDHIPILIALAHAVSAALILLHCAMRGPAADIGQLAAFAGGVLALDIGWALLNRRLDRIRVSAGTSIGWFM